MGISFTTNVTSSSEWYGNLEVSNIQLDGKPLTVNNWLVVSFNVPIKNFTGTDSWANFGPSPTSYINTKNIDSSTIQVTAYLQFFSSWTFKPANTLTFGVYGDMSNSQEVEKSVSLINDPSGTVNIQFVGLPYELVGSQVLTFTDGALVIRIAMKAGSPSSFLIVPSTFTVTATELTNEDQTIVATPQVSPSTISVENGKATSLTVTYDDVKHYSAIDVTIGNISPLQNEQFYGTVMSSGKKLADFKSPAHNKLTLYRLPQSGILDIGIGTITLNNVPYSFTTQTVDASVKPHQAVDFNQAVQGSPVPPPDAVKLPIELKTDVAPGATFTVRLTLAPANYIYTQQVEAKAGTTDFAVLVGPGNYTVQVSGFIYNSTVYVPEAPSTLTVEKDGKTKLTLQFNTGPNLKVPGFPNFLSFGGCTTADINQYTDFKSARASSVFKYAGEGGDGDPGKYLKEDLATINTIKLADKVGKELNKQVLPVMISYTCNFSGGGTGNLGDPDQLAHSFGNLILSLTDANKTIKGLKDSSVVAIGYVVNPDFLGECQKYQPDPSAPKGLSPDFPVKVCEALTKALQKREISLDIPTSIKDTLSGYVLAVNWLLRTIPSTLNFVFPVTFGWQVNLWGSGSAIWIYDVPEDPKNDPATVAQTTVNYINSLSLYNDPYRPDFLAVDRYERDDFTTEAGDYRFGPHEWPRYFDFCEAFSMSLKVPIMPWQIPSSHTPLFEDSVTDFDVQHWGTGGSYILGDEGLGSDYHNANPIILAMQFNRPLVPYKTVEDLFTRQAFDWSKPAYHDFPLRGIFAVLLGGGSTTGIVSSIGNPGPFARDRLHAYMDHPIPTDNFNT